MQLSAAIQHRVQAFLAGNPDEAILRWIFRSVVMVTAVVLAADLAGMNGWIGATDPTIEVRHDNAQPALPSLLPSIPFPAIPDGDKRLTPRPQADGAMARPMTFELVGGGRLMATGTITPGISEAFAAEIAKRGDYIRTVVLNSPGGSVTDALAMGRLIRERNFSTEIEAGKYCASSCPLLFAGGSERRVGDKAVLGVHQVAAVGAAGGLPRDEMNVAQNISARCQRYLGDMGVSLQVWVHAMETPHDKLFVFKPDELKSLNLVTTATAVPAAIAPRAAPTKGRS
jgi:hypothetical protein